MHDGRIPRGALRDASRGTPLEQAAAYRHNRGSRARLLGHALRCFAAGALALLAVFTLEQGTGRPASTLPSLLAAAAGIGFACAVVAGFVHVVAWLYLAHNER